jgi:UDP-2,3-diacylglucosamine pyrophosphatase LpxH
MITNVVEDRLLIISDLHLGNRLFPEIHRQLGALLRYAVDHGMSVCVNGDGVDVVQMSPGRFTREIAACYRDLRPLTDAGLRVYYVVGNHDIVFEHFLADWGGFITAPFLNVCSGELRIRVAHGHLHDEMFLRHPRLYAGVTVVGRWLIGRGPRLYERCEAGLAGLVTSVRKLMRWGRHAPERDDGIPGEHPDFRLAAEAVSLRGFDAVVFGHTHRPGRVRLASGATYYNTGAWMHRPRCVVVDHGRIWFGLVSDLLLGKATFDPVTAGEHRLDAPVHAVSRRIWSHA